METEVLDANGKALAVGTRVKVGPAPEDLGTIEEISDPDGDVDDEGRGFGINPQVTVRFDNGSDDCFGTAWTATGPWDDYGAPYRCDDVEVA